MRRLAPVAVLPALCAIAALAPVHAAQAIAPPGERLVAPVAGAFHFQGRGFGHGHGMSQEGAQGAASHGIDHKTILAAYYPGTDLVRRNTDPVRVLLSGLGHDGVRVAAAAGMQVLTDTATQNLPREVAGSPVTAWRVVTSGGTLKLSAVTDDGTHGWALPADADGGIELRNTSDVTRVLLSGQSREYRGALRAYPTDKGNSVNVVNLLDMDSYLRSVVPSESPAYWAPEALAAQAVAARTFALYHAAHTSTDSISDVCDTTMCQVYKGYRTLRAGGGVAETFEQPRSDKAVAASSGEVLLYDGKPALTQFSDSNGGWETSGGEPYLPSREDPWDGLSPNHAHLWNYTLTAARIAANWPQIGRPVGLAADRRDGNGPWGGRVLSVRVVGQRGQVVVPGGTFAHAMGMLNSWWQLQPADLPTAAPTAPAAPATPAPAPIDPAPAASPIANAPDAPAPAPAPNASTPPADAQPAPSTPTTVQPPSNDTDSGYDQSETTGPAMPNPQDPTGAGN